MIATSGESICLLLLAAPDSLLVPETLTGSSSPEALQALGVIPSFSDCMIEMLSALETPAVDAAPAAKKMKDLLKNPANAIPQVATFAITVEELAGQPAQVHELMKPIVVSLHPLQPEVNLQKQVLASSEAVPLVRAYSADNDAVPSAELSDGGKQEPVAEKTDAKVAAPSILPKTPTETIAPTPVPDSISVHSAGIQLSADDPAGTAKIDPIQITAPIALGAVITVTRTAEVPVNKELDSVERTKERAFVGSASVSHVSGGRHFDNVKPVAPPTVISQIHENLTQHVDQLRETGHAEVRMILHPPELGHVQLHLSVDDGQLNVRFLVQNEGAKHALDQQLEPLRVRFAEMGFSLGQFDVRRDGNFSTWQPPEELSGAERVRPDRLSVVESAPKQYLPLASSNTLVDFIV